MRLARQKGAATIEFALGGILLMLVSFAVIEVCFRIYVVNVTEYALRETIRETKTYQGKSNYDRYQMQFNRFLSQEGTLWHFLVAKDQFTLSAKYYKSYRDLVDNRAASASDVSPEYVLADITLSYYYQPPLLALADKKVTISRSMLLNLEHEGWPGEDIGR
ncbi:hypothetical protein ABT56_16320 [Photobacterium aquae]|uniref:TadE-like domain-containing protein n=1 Tax=Photobacterium aquae TaxID=1195763 RepID=A0A0J1GWZ2_9GAMM|nr:TadE family protein [Photobacterium aquae]KLV04171.1 hypothetical protein ABT56_16320 [Photobacterium aquae]